MHRISQELAMNTDAFGNPREGVKPETVRKLYSELWEAFEASKVGRELLRRRGCTLEKVMEIYKERHANRPPAVSPVYEVLQEIGQDLLVALPEPAVQAAPVVAQPAPAPTVKPEAPGDIKQFAFMVNSTVMTYGARQIKPKGGLVTLKLNDKSYEYPLNDFNEKLATAISFNLIR